MLSNVALAY